MVFFCCNNCGASCKKSHVDKHMFQCRGATFSCMDCQKNFDGNEYKLHTKCVTEEEKYAGEGWKAPASRNKGERKQMAWFETVQATMENAGKTLMPAARNLLQALTKHENVPRKKPKFLNFIRNVGRNQFDERTIDQVWGLLETQWKSETEKAKQEAEKLKQEAEQQKLAKSAEAVTSSDPTTDENKKGKKKKKSKNGIGSEEDKLVTESLDSVVETNGQGSVDEEEGRVKPKKNKKKRKTQDPEDDDTETSTKKQKLENIDHNVTLVDQSNGLEETPSKKSKKQKKNKVDESEAVPVPEINEVAEIEETPRKKKKKSKADRAESREALNGHDDNSLVEDQSSNDYTENGLTPEQLKAKLKAERKAARKAAKLALNGSA